MRLSGNWSRVMIRPICWDWSSSSIALRTALNGCFIRWRHRRYSGPTMKTTRIAMDDTVSAEKKLRPLP